MPPRRKGPSTADELQAEDIARKVEAHGEVRQNRGKRGTGKDVTRAGTGGGDIQEQVVESQQGSMATSRRQPSRRRGSNVLTPGRSVTVLPIQMPNSTPKSAQSSLKVQRGLDSLSAQLNHTQSATRPELKQDQALNLRSTSRTRKVVCYNEQSPSQPSKKKPTTVSKSHGSAKRNASACHNEQSPSQPTNKKPPIAPKSKGIAPAKRAASSALLLSAGAKRVKEDPTSTMVETSTPAPTTIFLKRGRTRDQKLKLLQSHDDENSAAVMYADRTVLLQEKLPITTAPATAVPMKRGGTKRVKEDPTSTMAETLVPAPTTVSHVKRGRTRDQKLKLLDDENCAAVMNADRIVLLQQKLPLTPAPATAAPMKRGGTRNQGLKLQQRSVDVDNADRNTGVNVELEELCCVAKSTIDDKYKSGQMAMPSPAKNTELDVEPEEVCGIAQSTNADRKIYPKAQKAGRKTVTRKGTIEGNAHDLLRVEEGGFGEAINAHKNLPLQTQGKGRKTDTRKWSISFERKGEETGNTTVFGISENGNDHDLKIEAKSLEKGGIQEPINARKNLQCKTGRTATTRKKTLPATREDDKENATKALKFPSVILENDHSDKNPEKIFGTDESSNGDNIERQQKENNSASRKRTFQGALHNREQKLERPTIEGGSDVHVRTTMDGKAQTSTAKRTMLGSTQYAKKLKMSGSPCQDTLPSMQKLVHVGTQDWNATDVANFGSKVYSSSEKKRKEEGRRKRARKFDALPVGFGLGIACWSPSPQILQGLDPQEVTQLSEKRDPTINMQEAVPEEIAMLEEADITLLRMNAFPSSATEIQKSSTSQSVPKRVCGIGLDSTPSKDANTQGGKAKVKRQVNGRTRKAIAASPQAVIGANTLDVEKVEPGIGLDSTPNKDANAQEGGKAQVKRQVGGRTRKALVASPQEADGASTLAAEKMEPSIDGFPIKTQQSSQTGAATRSKRTTRSTKQ